MANTYVAPALSPVHATRLQITLHDIIRIFRRLRDGLPLEDDTIRVLVQNTPISVGCFPEIIQCPEVLLLGAGAYVSTPLFKSIILAP